MTEKNSNIDNFNENALVMFSYIDEKMEGIKKDVSTMGKEINATLEKLEKYLEHGLFVFKSRHYWRCSDMRIYIYLFCWPIDLELDTRSDKEKREKD